MEIESLSKEKIPKPASTSKIILRSLLLNLLVNVLLYVGHLIIARRLVREDYATFTVVVSFVSLMALFADLGLTLLFVKKFAEAEALAAEGKKDERGELLGSMLVLRFGMAIVVSIATTIIAPLLGYPASTTHLMMIMLVTLFISSRLLVVRSVGEAFLRGHNKYHVVALLTAVDAVVFTGVLYFYSGKILDLQGAVWIYSLCHVPGFLLLAGLIYRDAKSIGFHLQFRFAAIRSMIGEGFPLILSTAFLTIHNQADALLIDKLSSPKEVSAFGAGLRVLSALIFLPGVFSAVIGPKVTQSLVKKDFEQTSLTVNRALKLLLLGALFIAILLSISSTGIVNILFGTNKYSDAAPLVTIFGWTFIPICFGAFITDIAIAEGKYWVPAVYTGIIMITSVTCDIILIPDHGALGAVLAKCISVTIGSLILFSISEKLIVLSRRRIGLLFFKLASVAVIALGAMYALTFARLSLVPLVLIIAVVFFIGTIFLIRIISISEIKMFIFGFFGKSNLKTADEG
jgi:O-antigen/teichoic acid export membrane protein